jgi:hypothetical protein
LGHFAFLFSAAKLQVCGAKFLAAHRAFPATPRAPASRATPFQAARRAFLPARLRIQQKPARFQLKPAMFQLMSRSFQLKSRS